MNRASKKELEQFGKRLNEIMEEKGISASELAKKLGISRQAVDNYRNAVSDPPISKLLKIADIFCVSVDWLLGRDDAVKTMDADIAAAVRCTGLTEDAVKLLANRRSNPLFPRINSPYEMVAVCEDVQGFYSEVEKAESRIFESGCAAKISESIALYKVAAKRLQNLLSAASLDDLPKGDVSEFGKLVYKIVEANTACKMREYEAKEAASGFVDDAIREERELCKVAFEKSKIEDPWNKETNLSIDDFIKIATEAITAVEEWENGQHPKADN